MADERLLQRVEVRFVGAPPAQRVERASGVSEVTLDGHLLRCTVHGSFQPFLEALQGYEVVSLKSTPMRQGHRRPERAQLERKDV